MLIKIAMTKGDRKRRITTCKPTNKSISLLRNFYPDSKWLEAQPFDTEEFTLHVSDAPLRDETIIQLPSLPYVETKRGYTRFEIQDSNGVRIRTTTQFPVNQLSLLTSDLHPTIIAEKLPIYLGVGPATKPEEVVIDPPEAVGVDTTVVVCPPGENVSGESNPKNGSQGEPVAGIKRIEHDLTDKELASKYLAFFLHHHISYSKGSKLTSKQLWAAIDANAPDGVRTDLLGLRVVTTAVRKHYGIVMDRKGERIGGENQKFWWDYEVRLYKPDSLEKKWL